MHFYEYFGMCNSGNNVLRVSVYVYVIFVDNTSFSMKKFDSSLVVLVVFI